MKPTAAHAGPEPPPGTTAERIAAIMADLLRQPTVGHDENFLHLGGNSLLAAQLVARIRSEFEIQYSLRAFFGHPTAAGVARALDDALTAGDGVSAAVQPGVVADSRFAQAMHVSDLDAPLAHQRGGDAAGG